MRYRQRENISRRRRQRRGSSPRKKSIHRTNEHGVLMSSGRVWCYWNGNLSLPFYDDPVLTLEERGGWDGTRPYGTMGAADERTDTKECYERKRREEEGNMFSFRVKRQIESVRGRRRRGGGSPNAAPTWWWVVAPRASFPYGMMN